MTPPSASESEVKPSRRRGGPDWATPEEIATELGVSAKLVYRLAATDLTFPAVKLSNVIRIRRSRLDRWLESHHPAKPAPKRIGKLLPAPRKAATSQDAEACAS